MFKFEYDEKLDGILNLVVKFEVNKINVLIKDLNLFLWGIWCLLVVIWLVIEDNWWCEFVM